jgi:hypothetical protein
MKSVITKYCPTKKIEAGSTNFEKKKKARTFYIGTGVSALWSKIVNGRNKKFEIGFVLQFSIIEL